MPGMETRKKRGTKFTPPEEIGTVQRSYREPVEIENAWSKFVEGKTRQDEMSAMKILWMALEDYPMIRDKAVRLTKQYEVKEAVKHVRELLEEEIKRKLFMRATYDKMTDEERKKQIR